MTLKKIAIFATHPVQYHIPWFQELTKQTGFKVNVYFACKPDKQSQGIDFNVPFEWDIPLLEGYAWKVLENRRKSPGLNGFFTSIVKNLGRVLNEEKPDVIILTGWQSFPMFQALFWSIFLRIPRIIRGESNALKPRKNYLFLFHRLLLSTYHAFLSIGKENRRFYLDRGIDQGAVFSCPYFIDNQRFINQAYSEQEKKIAIRKSWDIPDNHFCFIYVGKLVSKKRIFDLLHALKETMNNNSKIHLLIVGTGELMHDAQNYVQDNNLPVTFAGFLNQTEITRAYIAGDCLVLPSDYGETWGLVINEAMVCGLPAIVSDRVGCHSDLVKQGETGMVYPFGDIPALVECITTIASDPQNAIKMGQSAKENIINNYNVENAVKGTISAVKYVLDGQK